MNGCGIKVRAIKGIEVRDQPAPTRISLELQTLRLGDFIVGTFADIFASERTGEPWIFLESSPFSKDPNQKVDYLSADPSDKISEGFHVCVIIEGLLAKVVFFLPKLRVPRVAESAW